MTHLDLLIDYIGTTYAPTTHSLGSLLSAGEITYDLLWAFFKPNTVVYTTCFGSGKPRCVMHDFGEEKESQSGAKFYSLKCRYHDYDGEIFGEASIKLKIPKFHGTKRINLLEAFPLRYHIDRNEVRADLVQRGRKFLSLMGSHHCHFHGTAFYMKKGMPVQMSVNSRVVVDAGFFRKLNPNYSREPVTDPAVLSANEDGWTLLDDEPSNPPPDQLKSNGVTPAEIDEEDLLICCPTVLGFSLGDKLWCKTIFLCHCMLISTLKHKSIVEFAVADIKDIKWSLLPFANLTIPDEQRKVIMALAETHMGQVPGVGFDDFVAGKGRGLNVLLQYAYHSIF
jgi:hypothetical protein